MKKIISVLFLAILIAGCSPAENEVVGGIDLEQKATSCTAVNGKWLVEQKECEYVSKEWCVQEAGVFEECGSACRHNPAAEICTKQCVMYCKF